MSDAREKRLNVGLRLSPLRIAFLIDRYDPKQIRQAIQINTCLWGGMYNPIVPIYQSKPKISGSRGHRVTEGHAEGHGVRL